MSFDRAVALVLKHEGGYVNDSRDPGGETRYGISKRAYPDVDILRLTEDEAKAIYKRDYWDTLRPDEIPEPLAICLFDAAVNMGAVTSVRLLQTTLNLFHNHLCNLSLHSLGTQRTYLLT